MILGVEHRGPTRRGSPTRGWCWCDASRRALPRPAPQGWALRHAPSPSEGRGRVRRTRSDLLMPAADPRSATISVVVENEAGVLARVIGLFSGRGYNIDSLTVAPGRGRAPPQPHQHRDLRHRDGDRADQGAARPAGAGASRRRPDAARPAHRARDGADQGAAARASSRSEALRIAQAFRARVVDATTESFVFELTGATDKLDAFLDLMRPLGLAEVSRTGVAAIARGTRTI